MSNEQIGNAGLSEGYVKDHYNQGLRNMEEEYNDRRWFSSVEAKFDHQQTKYALMHALDSIKVETALEVGPGDGVWTRFFANRIKNLTLLDQSEEMIGRAKTALQNHSHIDYRVDNFATADIPTGFYNLIVSVRCFEYIIDKAAAVRKFANALAPGGRFVLITKNPDYRTLKNWRRPLLHTEQISKNDLVKLFKAEGLIVEAVYPAVFRWKSSYLVFRLLFSFLQRVAVLSGGRLYVPWLTNWATESYTYVVRKDSLNVELYGLPGSGKSTLATALEKNHSTVQRFRPVRRSWGVLFFIFNHPVVFLFWIKEMLVSTFSSGDWTFFRYRLAILIGTFEAVGRIEHSKASITVLEEGLVQRICSVYERKLEPAELLPLLARMPISDVLVVVDASQNYFHRYQHPSNPRGQRGEVYLEQFKEMLVHNHQSLLEVLKDWHYKTIYYKSDSTPEGLYNQLVSL